MQFTWGESGFAYTAHEFSSWIHKSKAASTMELHVFILFSYRDKAPGIWLNKKTDLCAQI